VKLIDRKIVTSKIHTNQSDEKSQETTREKIKKGKNI
jgi:hypothetical protein